MARSSDIRFMTEALRLAKKGEGNTLPNPMVGAVVVKDGRVVGRGFHKKAGARHAEVEALRKAGRAARRATLYVTLEPCNHTGRTPPCTDAIRRAGISRVVCASHDPNRSVKGGGISAIRRHKIRVSTGVLNAEARALNRQFFTFHQESRPFVAVKFAASLDGKLATSTGDSKWITNSGSRAYARHLRATFQAIVVGANTVLKDDPHLGVRQKGKRDPLRIIIDPALRAPLSSKVFRDGNVLVAALHSAPKQKRRIFEKRGISVALFKGRSIPVRKLVAYLKDRGIVSILVEGGGETIGRFLDVRAVDEAYAFYAPILIGGNRSVSVHGKGIKRIKDALSFPETTVKVFGNNVLVHSGKHPRGI